MFKAAFNGHHRSTMKESMTCLPYTTSSADQVYTRTHSSLGNRVLRLIVLCAAAFIFVNWHECYRTLQYIAPSFYPERTPLCLQAAPLTPEKHAELHETLSDTLTTDIFLKRAVDLLAGSVQIPTEVYDVMGPIGEDPRWDVFGSFHEYLTEQYPKIHSMLDLTKVNTYGLVYTWKGSDESLKPLLLAAHQDVVPVNRDTYAAWQHPPFSGYFDGEYVWGRGSVDDKNGLISVLTAAELLLEHDFKPRRSVVLAFGFDEEGSGRQGAYMIGKYLLSTYGEHAFSMLVDEGGEIEKQYGGIFALPAITEKGYLDVLIEVSAPGGHSSIPPAHTTIGILSRLLVHYENHAPPAELSRSSPMYEHAQCLAVHAPDLPPSLRKSIKRSLSSDNALRRVQDELFKDPDFRATVSTTQAVDIISGGVKSNALPENAMAVVNHRIAIDSSVAAVQSRSTAILKSLAEHFNLSYTAFGAPINVHAPTSGNLSLIDAWNTALEPAPITPSGEDAAPFQLLAGTIKATYNAHRSLGADEKRISVSPSMGSGNTDTQFYWRLTQHIFRYTHYDESSVNASMSGGAHTVNEACKADNLVEMIRFYVTLILNADEADSI